MTTVENINLKLDSIFKNGRLEVGLEVGSDPGLSPDNYVHIPKSFSRAWAYCTVAEPAHQPKPGDGVDTLKNKKDWIVVDAGKKHVRIHKGVYSAVNPDGTGAERMEHFYRAPYTVADIKQFMQVNNGHVRDDQFSVETKAWVTATRFWSLASGFLCGTKQKEWVEVDDATDTSGITDNDAAAVAKDPGTAITACAARGASWRKSNHATGGDIAAGFPRRWLAKNSYWSSNPDVQARKREQKLATDAFYVATHASCVHPILAMMAAADEDHWAQIDPQYGMIMNWEILESTSIRISPKTQVAGTAIVVDSMVVLRMLVSEGLVALLESSNQFQALNSAYKTVEAGGIRTASYANWFLNGHPDKTTRISFGQKDTRWSALAGELAAVARTFYRNTTIGESLALENAMQQLASETAKSRWSAMTKAKKSAGNEVIMSVYTRIVGASTSSSLAMLSSQDRGLVKTGVEDYNRFSAEVARAIGVEDPVLLDYDRVVDNMGITPAISVHGNDDADAE